MRRFFWHIFFVIGLFLLVFSGSCGGAKQNEEISKKPRSLNDYFPVALSYAPVFVQSVSSSYDIPTNFDFDGDFIGNNNWENAEKFEKKPYVYWDIKEGRRFFFIHYALFYPRDYLEDCKNPPPPENCHENDWEALLVVVDKEKRKVVFFETLPHIASMVYALPEINVNPQGLAMKGKNAQFFDGRPVIFVEWGGHGQYGSYDDIFEKEFFSFDLTVVFFPKGFSPENFPFKVSSYELISIYDTFWKRKDDVGTGKTFDNYFEFSVRDKFFRLPKNFDGDISGEGVFKEDAASAPWYAHSVPGEQGIWFIDPAEILRRRTGIDDPQYLFNLYLDISGVQK